MSINYTVFYKDYFDPKSNWSQQLKWDVFISAYNTTDRVKTVFQDVRAQQKCWVVHTEYGFQPGEIPQGNDVYAPADVMREDEFVLRFLDSHCGDLTGKHLCIDISGFMRPHLMWMLIALAKKGVRVFDALYSEPSQYAQRHSTTFSKGDVFQVRPVAGFEGLHQPTINAADDVLVIGAGYEHELMNRVAAAKRNARKFQLLGFPPLQADFYQENVLNVRRAAESVRAVNERNPTFIPTNDPFVTASVLQKTVDDLRSAGALNIYLCPLSTHPQALGFAIYHLYEAQSKAVSIIYPFAANYERASATGISRIWKYQVELP